MKYYLFKKVFLGGTLYYRLLMESDDIGKIKDRIISYVRREDAVDDFIIVRDVPFEFKCAIKLIEEETHV